MWAVSFDNSISFAIVLENLKEEANLRAGTYKGFKPKKQTMETRAQL